MKNLNEMKATLMNLSLPIGVAIIEESPELKILYTNEMFTKMLGFDDMEDFIKTYQHSAWKCIYFEDLQRLQEAAPTRIGIYEPYEVSYRVVKKDGSILWVNQNSQHMLDENGVELIFAYYTDITTQKQQEAAILAGAQKYESLVNSIPGGVGMYQLNETFTPIFISGRVYELCGMTREEYVDATRNSTLDVFHPDDRQGIIKAVEKARKENNKFEYTHRVRQKDGSYRWMRVSGQVMEQLDGTPVLYTVFTDIHEQIQTEYALRESESRYAAAVRSANINIWEYDYNTDTMTIFSKSPKINVKSNIIPNYIDTAISGGHISKESAPLLLEMVENLKNGENEVTADLWIRNHPEEEFWCERVIYTNAFDDAGNPVKAYCVGRDITKEKEAEKRYRDELSYREAMQKATMASINVNLTKDIILDYKSVFPEVADNMEKAKTVQAYFDYLYTKIASNQIEQCRAIFNREALLRQFENGETTLSIEMTRKIGNRRYWTMVTVHMMKKENNDIVAFLYSRDITNERTMQYIMDTIVKTDYDFLVVIDVLRDSAIRYSEKNFGHDYANESTNFEKETQDYVRQFVSPEDVPRVLEEITRRNILAQLENQATYSVFYGTPDVGQGTCKKQLRFSYINREIKSILMTRVDITAAVKEQEKKNQELVAAVEMAECANAAKSEFLSRISHEIRTPMNAIMGMDQLAMQCLNDPISIKECIEKSQYASRYLLQLLNDILDMSKIERGKVTLKEELIVCQPFLDSISSIIQIQATEKNVKYIVTRFECCRNSYIGDGVRLQQVLINILTNAIKFTPQGGTVSLDISQIDKTETCANICFTISDTGIGIGKKFLPDIFKPFAQEHGGIRSGYGGSGLGLAISKNLVELMGGEIIVESVLGKGTTFRVQIPFGIPEYETKTDTEMSRKIHYENYDFSGKRVLLVEDHQLNIMVARKLLEFKHASVDVAENGKIGLELFANAPEHTYDVILMDIRMPIMDGLQSTEAIRNLDNPWAKAVPIVAMSANAFDEDIIKSKNAGMNVHLAKPIEAELLYQTLYELFQI
ncbi:MAG: PAS domain-containing protein [Lachnospiraceae bacterium]